MIFSLLFLIPTDIDSIILKGMEAGYQERFFESESLFKIVVDRMPEHPAGYFLMAALYQLEYMDMGFDSLKNLFFMYAKIAEDTGESYIKKHPEDPWGYFFTGGTYAIEVFFSGYSGNYINAIRKAGPALRHLSKAVELDSTLYDAYLGLGGYDYFKGIIPFMGSEREKGLKKINLAIEKAHYTRFLAATGLANLYIRERKFKEARDVLKPVLKAFPESRTFTWPYFTTFYEEGNLDSLLFWGKRLMDLSKDNPYGMLQTQSMIAERLIKEKRYREVLEITEHIPESRYFEKLVKKVKSLRKKAKELMEKR